MKQHEFLEKYGNKLIQKGYTDENIADIMLQHENNTNKITLGDVFWFAICFTFGSLTVLFGIQPYGIMFGIFCMVLWFFGYKEQMWKL